jgi:hypothetical protein
MRKNPPSPPFEGGLGGFKGVFLTKPEPSLFKALQIFWTPVFAGVTAQNQFFHTFPL